MENRIFWCEFPMLDSGPHEDNEKPKRIVARLQTLLNIARKLYAAGWPMCFTLTGLSFGVPFDSNDFDVRKVKRALSRLGISEPFNLFPSRTVSELGEAQEEFFSRVQYMRDLHPINPDDPNPYALDRMAENEQKYGLVSLRVKNGFDWGMVNGKLSALRWLTGDNWDNLDT